MRHDFKNIDFQDVDLEEYNSIDIKFSNKEKEDTKKKLRKKIIKRKNKEKRISGFYSFSIDISIIIF